MQCLHPLTFGDLSNDFYYEWGFTVRNFAFALIAFSINTPRAKDIFLLIVLYGLFTNIHQVIFGLVDSKYYLIESIVFLLWTMALMLRTHFSTSKTLLSVLKKHDEDGTNYDNILLFFYRGEKGSFIMHLSSLFGLDVKSMAIGAGEKCLMLKSSKGGFVFADIKIILKNKENYLIVDTGKKVTPEFIAKMENKNNKPAKLFGLFRVRCIEGVHDLLSDIGPEYEPTSIFDNDPGIYLKKVASC